MNFNLERDSRVKEIPPKPEYIYLQLILPFVFKRGLRFCTPDGLVSKNPPFPSQEAYHVEEQGSEYRSWEYGDTEGTGGTGIAAATLP